MNTECVWEPGTPKDLLCRPVWEPELSSKPPGAKNTFLGKAGGVTEGMRISHKGGDRPSLSGTTWIGRTHPEVSAVHELSGLDVEPLLEAERVGHLRWPQRGPCLRDGEAVSGHKVKPALRVASVGAD